MSAPQAIPDPARFRQQLTIPGGRGAVRFSDAMADFQARDFAAMDPAFLALARGEQPPIGRFWWERTKGASKDSDAAVMLLWLLAFSPRALSCQVGAADQDQADELRKAAKAILRLNPWLAQIVTIQSWTLVNTRTDARCEILSADVAGSHGARPDLLVLNELSHVGKQEFAENLLDNAAKVPFGIVLVATNAGFIGTWQETWRRTAEESPRWYFSSYQQPAPWLDPAEIEEARRRNGRNRFLRLWQGQWVPDQGDALSQADIDAAVKPDLAPLEVAEPEWSYAGGLDIGLSQDATALVIVGKRHGRYRLAYARAWKPSHGVRVDLDQVESKVFNVHRRFGLRVLAYDPFQAVHLAGRLAKMFVPMQEVPFTGSNLTGMATATIDAFTTGSMSLYRHPDLLADLSKLRLVEKAYGTRLESPRGPSGHGDLACALSLALFVGKDMVPNVELPGQELLTALEEDQAKQLHGFAAMEQKYRSFRGRSWGPPPADEEEGGGWSYRGGWHGGR